MRTLGIIVANRCGALCRLCLRVSNGDSAVSAGIDGWRRTGQCTPAPAVIQVTYGKNVRLLGASGEIYIEVKGEPVAVDIPGRGTLFAVLKQGAPGEMPLLVRFRDMNDPKTLERVDPNDLAASFGPGVYLKRGDNRDHA
jgi:hypothetical protein